LLLSWLSLWLALLLLYKLASERYDEKTALFSVIALLVFPGSFYFLTAFPYALYLLLALSVFRLIQKQAYRYLFVPAGLLAVTYPSGIIIGLPILYHLISRWRPLEKRNRIYLISAFTATGAALLLFCFYYWFKFGDFFLYLHFQAQSYYAHEASFPLRTIMQSLIDYNYNSPVFIILVFTLLSTLVFYTKKMEAGWQLYLFALLLFTPTFGTTDCYYRHIIPVFPLYIMGGLRFSSGMGRFLYILYTIIAVILTALVYLPAYKTGTLM